MLDVTDSRRMESALRERNEALEAADKVKTAFLSRMSYELRTPLTSIGGFGEMLRAGYAGQLADQHPRYVDAYIDRKRVGEGNRGQVRVDFGGCRNTKKYKQNQTHIS